VITAALVVVRRPGDTVTFVRQERGPYAGWWLLPGGMPILNDADAAAYPGELIAGRLARERIAMTNLLTGETFGRQTISPAGN
jgi:ADP-ribose pyrophosphatase YjhB (NUDIX family)